MNLAEVKKRALSIMAEYSLDGVITPEGDNADYLNRMNRYASDAQMEICDRLPIESLFTIKQLGSNEGGFYRYPLPDDFKESNYITFNDTRFSDYRIVNHTLLIPKDLTGSFDVYYYKYPDEISADTPDSYELEIERKGQHIIPYFLGAMALIDENPSLSDKLLNLYYSKVQSLTYKSEDYPNEINSIFRI